MTFEEMRAEMRRKVVPENVIPQNIIEYLMDDSAELPELDAFTFLNRLRSLGIGSADFQYLLEACGAPAKCVEKIKRNPAMNLQNLILTLENSGLTAKDYTVMLYTARQIWERTLTIRLEKSSDAAEEIGYVENEPEEEVRVPAAVGKQREEPEEIASDAVGMQREEAANPAPEAAGKQREEPANPVSKGVLPAEEDEDSDEPSLEEVLRQVRLLDNRGSYREDESAEEAEITRTAIQKAPEEPEIIYTEETEEIEEPEPPAHDVGGLTSDFSKIFDIIKENKHSAREDVSDNEAEDIETEDITAEDKSEYAEETAEVPAEEPVFERTETMSVTRILAGMRKNAPEKPAERDIFDEEDDEPEAPVEDEAEISADEDYDDFGNDETAPLIEIDQTLFRKDRPKITREETHAEERYEDDYSEDEEEKDYPEKPAKSRANVKYHIKALIAGAVGAAALAVLAVFAGKFGEKTPEMYFAQTNDELFTKVFESYMPEEERFIGGENICAYSDTCGIFGELLINKNGEMNFSDDKNVYCVSSEKISVESFDGTILDSAKYIVPPAKTSFVTAFEQDGALYCVFSGDTESAGEKECGYMKIKDGTALFTVRQDGVLSDFSLDGGKISLGSVYVPKYSKSFSADDTDVYLPRVGKDEKKPLTAENVAVSGTKGCSFAVCAEYTLDSGESSAAKAVLGNPVSASADYKAAFNGKSDETEYGLLVSFKDGITAKKCEKISAAAFGKDFAVTLEGENANLRSADFTAKSALSNFAEKAEKLKISGSSLLVGNKDGFFAAFDCGDISQPTAMKLTKTNGIVSGDYAAIFSVDGGLEITLYKRNGEKADVIGKYTKTFTEDELKTLILKGAETTAFAADSCGAAFEYFDGVSVISQYVVFGRTEGSKTLYDDKTGFTRAFAADGKIYAVSSKGFDCVTGKNT